MSNKYLSGESLTVDTSHPQSKNADAVTYEIMHMEKIVARITPRGEAEVIDQQFLPFDLFLEESTDFDTLLNNLDVFRHWCASRVLSLDRKYAKEILNSIGVAQAITDKERAKIALSYHCVSLTDVYWVRKLGDSISFAQLNLYDNPLKEAIVELSLRGRQMTVTNQELAPDLSTKGCFPKAWIRGKEGFRLLKDGGETAVRRELLASQICQCFNVNQVVYREFIYDGELVTESKIVTSKRRSMVSKMSYDIYAINNDIDTIEKAISIDRETYYGMNILDYLTGNTDRHPENWGFLVDNDTNELISLYPLMDFNMCFSAYDSLDGARCQTVGNASLTQREAAIEAVKKIGLPLIREMDMSKFGDMKQEAEMFTKRLAELKKYVK